MLHVIVSYEQQPPQSKQKKKKNNGQNKMEIVEVFHHRVQVGSVLRTIAAHLSINASEKSALPHSEKYHLKFVAKTI